MSLSVQPASNRPSAPTRISAPEHRAAPVDVEAPAAAPDPAPDACAALLRTAADDVRYAWTTRLSDTAGESECAAAVEWIHDAIGAATEDRAPRPLDGQIALSRFLLERFATTLLSLIATDPRSDKADTIRLMRGVESVRRQLEPDWDRYFASQFTGPDGLSLVTEVAHDLRSPLTSIRCLAEAIERGQSGPVTDVQRKQLRLIYSAALGLGTMTSDVIELARRGEQLADIDVVPFSVAEMLDGVVDMVRPIAEEKGLVLATQRLAGDRRLGSPFALSRVLLNLVTNALKFTDEGRVEVQVRATGLAAVEFAVIDTGHGIPESAIPDLFKPFRTSTGRSGRSEFLFSGTGLGLALCRRLVQAMGSTLQFETSVGEGTKFWFVVDLPMTSER